MGNGLCPRRVETGSLFSGEDLVARLSISRCTEIVLGIRNNGKIKHGTVWFGYQA